MTDAMSPAEAGALADRARKLRGAREITPHEYALFDALLWSCRRHGTSTTRAAYSQLQRLAGVARATIAGGLEALERVGLIARTKARIVATGVNGGRIWKQLPNTYRFLVSGAKRPISREFSGRPDSKPQEIHTVQLEVARPAQADARGALERIAADRAARQGAKWLRARGWA